MIPYYAYKRYKQNQALKDAALDKKDEQFFAEAVDKSPPPPEPSTPATTVDSLFQENKSDWNKEKEKKSEPWGQTIKRWGTLGRAGSSSSVTKKVSYRYNSKPVKEPSKPSVQDGALPTPSSSRPETPAEPPKPATTDNSAGNANPSTPVPERKHSFAFLAAYHFNDHILTSNQGTKRPSRSS
jgi:hypothetical protein